MTRKVDLKIQFGDLSVNEHQARNTWKNSGSEVRDERAGELLNNVSEYRIQRINGQLRTKQSGAHRKP
jgi:hypothetical protein